MRVQESIGLISRKSKIIQLFSTNKIKEQLWKEQSLNFWLKQPETYDGVLLGYSSISDIDIEFSHKFMNQLKAKRANMQRKTVLDCGSGIGRVSSQLLCGLFDEVDILEQCPHFISTAKSLLKDRNVKQYYQSSLQDFQFVKKYDCIWIQWVLTHLREADFINFIKKSRENLSQYGCIIIKQNISPNKKIIDKTDSTIIRTDSDLKRLMLQEGGQLIYEQIQNPWPVQLQAVKMYALI